MTQERQRTAVATAPAPQEQRPATIFEQLDRDLAEMRERLTGFFRRPFAPLFGPSLLRDVQWTPTADAYEAAGTLIVKAELPGVKREDISVTIRDGVLTVEGKREEEKEAKDGRRYTAERFSGRFARSFALPEGVDPGAISSAFQDGVLEVRVPLPTRATAEPVRIPITGTDTSASTGTATEGGNGRTAP